MREKLKGYEGPDIHEDEEQYKDHDDHHYEVGTAHAFSTPFDPGVSLRRYSTFFVQPKRLDLPDATAHSGKTPFSTAEARPA